jgi:hypothetical protein
MTATFYLHGDKETAYAKGEELGLTGKALEYFTYACYEVKVDGNVDPNSGAFIITHVDRKALVTD